jgi:hypothetical protein
LVALMGAPALGQDDGPPPEDLRAGIDENQQERSPEPIQRSRRDEPAAGHIRRYGVPPGSGAGRSGFISTNLPRPKPKGGPTRPEERNPPGSDRMPDLDAEPNASAAARARRAAVRPGKVRAGAGKTAPAPLPARKVPAAAWVGRADVPNRGDAGPTVQPRRLLVEEDPFAPIGIRAGAFLLRPAVEILGGYDSNPARVANGPGSPLVIVAPELRVNSDWERHALRADIHGSYSDYPSVPFADRPFLDARVDGRIDAARDTRVDLEARYLLSTENPGSPNLPAGLAKLPIYTDVGATAGIDRRFNRLDVALRGAIDRVDYQDSLLTDGTSASNKDRDYSQYGVQARAGYEITPGLRPFVELDADRRVHDLPVDQSGYARDSDGLTPKAGTSFEITRKLTGEISVGYLMRTYKDPRLADLRGVIADSSLVWSATGLTTVKLTATSAAAESVLPGVSGLFQRDVGIEVDHAFRRWLLGTFKLGWGLDEYVGLDRRDRRYAASLGLVYKLSRDMQLKTELRQYWLRSNVSDVDYTATAILVGLRLQR